MGWTTAEDLRLQVLRQWESGRILTASLREEAIFPLALVLRRPDQRAYLDRFEEVRSWIVNVESGCKSRVGYGYDLRWKEIRHRQLGTNRVPAGVSVASEQDALLLIGKSEEQQAFQGLADETIAQFPVLRSWLIRRPFKLLEHAGEWHNLLAVIGWFVRSPAPGIYLRQVDIPGVDTKFIERHQRLLCEVLDEVLPAPGDSSMRAASFEERYGFVAKPVLIRFRILDSNLALAGLTDLTVPVRDFAKLALPIERVFITENDLNGLTFPAFERSIVVFGLGYAISLLSGVPWLRAVETYYWGDIDTHGFVMLDRLRAIVPEVKSLLMDRSTLMAHRECWVEEAQQSSELTPRLMPEEGAMLQDLRCNTLGWHVRLEQERIAFRWVEDAVERLRHSSSK